MVVKLKQAWKRDPLAVLGVGSAVVAFLMWALPYSCYKGWVCGFNDAPSAWFSISRGNEGFSAEAQWVLVFALASLFLLIARAGNRR
jgi:hypothetical protein